MADDNHPNGKIVSFPSSGKKKLDKKQTANRWSISYKKNSWSSGDKDEKVGPNSKANAGFKNTSGQPFFKFGNIPPLTKILVVAFFIIHVAFVLLRGSPDMAAWFDLLAFAPGRWNLENLLHYPWLILTSFSYMFLHGGWLHLVFNSIMMLAFGSMCERLYGSKLTAFLLALGSVTGAITYLLIAHQSPVHLIGASAAISALFGFILLDLNDRQQEMSGQRNTGIKIVILWLVIMVLTGLWAGKSVAWPAHITGFLAGLAWYKLRNKFPRLL